MTTWLYNRKQAGLGDINHVAVQHVQAESDQNLLFIPHGAAVGDYAAAGISHQTWSRRHLTRE